MKYLLDDIIIEMALAQKGIFLQSKMVAAKNDEDKWKWSSIQLDNKWNYEKSTEWDASFHIEFTI